MSKKTARIHMRLNTEEKELMKNKANKLGFKSTSAFILDSAYNFFMIYLDLSHLSQVAKEINHVGNNINNQVHHIFATGIYSDYDLKEIQRLQKEIIIIMRREYDYLSLEKRRYSVNDKKKLINELKKHNIEIPKQILLEEVYEHIRANIKYICKLIDDSTPNNWCHGAPGVSLTYLSPENKVPRNDAMKLMKNIIDSTNENICLCHGIVGNQWVIQYINKNYMNNSIPDSHLNYLIEKNKKVILNESNLFEYSKSYMVGLPGVFDYYISKKNSYEIF